MIINHYKALCYNDDVKADHSNTEETNNFVAYKADFMDKLEEDLGRIKNWKAKGQDGFNGEFKSMGVSSLNIITFLYYVLKNTTGPQDWLTAWVVSIFKKGKQND